MKTTIDIADALFEEARKVAAREDTTFRSLVEEGLRRVLAGRRRRPVFRLRRVTFGGRGVRPEFQDWERIRAEIYEGRGA
jgi:hypothetical protein